MLYILIMYIAGKPSEPPEPSEPSPLLLEPRALHGDLCNTDWQFRAHTVYIIFHIVLPEWKTGMASREMRQSSAAL